MPQATQTEIKQGASTAVIAAAASKGKGKGKGTRRKAPQAAQEAPKAASPAATTPEPTEADSGADRPPKLHEVQALALAMLDRYAPSDGVPNGGGRVVNDILGGEEERVLALIDAVLALKGGFGSQARPGEVQAQTLEAGAWYTDRKDRTCVHTYSNKGWSVYVEFNPTAEDAEDQYKLRQRAVTSPVVPMDAAPEGLDNGRLIQAASKRPKAVTAIAQAVLASMAAAS